MLKQDGEINQLANVTNTFAGLDMQQTWHALYALNRFIQNEPIMRIIELGTAQGGLTVFFAMLMRSRGGKVHSFDYVKPTGQFELFRGILPIIFHQKSVFDEKTVDFVRVLMKEPRRTLIFCDNGNKPKEMDLYAPLLKRGDCLMAHDYGTEVLEADVSAIIDRYKLRFNKQELFDEYSTYIVSMIK